MKNKSELGSYFKFFYSYIGYRFFIVIALSISVGLLDGIGLTMLIPLLQSLEGGVNSNTEQLGQLNHVIYFLKSIGLQMTVNVVLSIFISLFIFKGLFRFLESIYHLKVHLLFMRKTQYNLLNNIKDISYKGFLELDAGKIQNTFIAEVYRMSQGLKSYMKWGQGLVMVITYISLAFLANYKFTFLVVGSSLLTNIFYRSLHKKIKLASYEISRTGHNLNAYMIEMIHYFKYLKSTNYLTSFSKKVKSIINIRQDINRKTGLYSAISTSIREPIIVLIVSLVIFIQLNLIGGSLGSIILSLLLFYRGLNYLLTIQKEWQSFILNSGAIQNVCEVSERMQELKEPGGNRKFEVINEKIILKNINLSYGNVKVLKNIEIFIPKKTTIALVGASGSGKTTLVNIISGLLKPDEGDVYIDNLSLQEYNLNTYRNKIGYISQEPVVFNDTIFNNITFWAEKNAENIKHFKKVIELASLKEFIDDLENKEDTYLGDHGILISGGQKQRISIARELFKNPEILILDEATSALDSETEKLIQENLDNLHGSYTMIVIAHRLSTIKKADIIYLMDKGKILDEGSYNDLLKSSKKFKHLVTLQQL